MSESNLSPAALRLLAAFPGSSPEVEPTLWAGLDVDVPLPAGLAEAIEIAGDGWRWAPCTTCGRGALIERPSVPRVPRDLGAKDGSACRMTPGCKGRHYPLDGPMQHPLAHLRYEGVPW